MNILKLYIFNFFNSMSKQVTFSKETKNPETKNPETKNPETKKKEVKKRIPFLINVEYKNITAEKLIFNKFDFTFTSSLYDKVNNNIPEIYKKIYKYIKSGEYKKGNSNNKYSIVTYSPDISVSVSTIGAIAEKYNDIKIIIFTSRARIDTNIINSNSMFKYTDNLISSLLKEMQQPFITTQSIIEASQICVIGVNENYISDSDKHDLNDIFGQKYISLTKIKNNSYKEVMDTYVFDNCNSPIYVIFDLSVMAFNFAPMALRNFNGKKINNISEIDGMNLDELSYIFERLSKLNIVGLDVTNYNIEKKSENDDRALKVTCETARLPAKIIFNLKEYSFNIFNEYSKFLICRPLISDTSSDTGWYIFRNITENENDLKLNNIIKNKIISEIEDNIILFDPLNPPLLSNIYDGKTSINITENSEYTMFLTTTTINEQNMKRFIEGDTDVNEKILYPAEKTRMLFEIL